MKRKEIFLLLAVTLLIVTLPYILAFAWGGSAFSFSGFLLNPVDGNSYLAKMHEGWSGAWRFTLPYTAEPGEGAYLFLYYLFLGHVARWLGPPLIAVYHLARIAAVVALVFALAAFFNRVFRENPPLARFAAWLAALSSGMGWTVMLAGALTSDFWVAEAYPFLASYANPHFPLGLAILLYVLVIWIDGGFTVRRLALLAALGLLESIILPFALVVIAVILLVDAAWQAFQERSIVGETRPWGKWPGLIAVLSLGGPFLLYQFWAALSDPALAGWNAQNLTPSPELWDFVLSFSPALPLALWGGWTLKGEWGRRPGGRLLAGWMAAGLILVYLPFSLQRRFMLGLYIPLAGLAVIGVSDLSARWKQKRLAMALLILSLPTNLFLLLAGVAGALSHSPEIYLSRDEVRALDWVSASSPAHALIASSPGMGSFIPAYTGRRVLYGHPFETVNARVEEANLLAFYQGDWAPNTMRAYLEQRGIGYVFYGPREQALGAAVNQLDLKPLFTSGEVTIYQAGSAP